MSHEAGPNVKQHDIKRSIWCSEHPSSVSHGTALPVPLSCQHTSSSLFMSAGPTSALTQRASKMAQASTWIHRWRRTIVIWTLTFPQQHFVLASGPWRRWHNCHWLGASQSTNQSVSQSDIKVCLSDCCKCLIFPSHIIKHLLLREYFLH